MLLQNGIQSRMLDFLYRLKEKIKRIWYVLAGKEYCYCEICMKEDDIRDFKDFVSRI